MKKLIISAALVGGGITPTQGPYIPIKPDDIAREAKRAEDAGAAIVHIHPRNPDTGELTADINIYQEILSKIHHTTNLVICPSTAIGRGFNMQELEQIYRHLLEIDIAVKTGQADMRTSLDLLVANLTITT